MSRIVLTVAFVLGLVAVLWVGVGFVGTSALALAMSVVIGAVYVLGAMEIRRFRAVTASLQTALSHIPQPLAQLGDWLAGLHPSVQNAVRARVEGERVALPGLALTPYLPARTVLVLGADVEGTRAYGAIKDEAAGFQAMPYFAKSWVEQDPAVRYLMLQSAPLTVPYRVNASLGATV